MGVFFPIDSMLLVNPSHKEMNQKKRTIPSGVRE